MSVTSQSPAQTGSSSPHRSAVVGDVGVEEGGASDFPQIGQCWRERYEVLEERSAPSGQRCWVARAKATHETVWLRAFPSADRSARDVVAGKLRSFELPYLQRLASIESVGAARIEVEIAPPGVPFSEWRAAAPIVDAAVVKTLVGHLAEALGVLHAHELAHLGVSPENLFVEQTPAGPTFILAGLNSIQALDAAKFISVAAHPAYAPPEAVGLTQHAPGPALCEWDWWSVGRVVQELVLGRPLAAHLFPDAPEPLARVAELLLEADPKSPRAGAVETMPELDPAVRLLLRGLLTTARDARWTGDNVDRWLRGQPVKELYDTPRKETHLRWHGRPYTVAELAATLQSRDNWPHAAAQLCDEKTRGTLGNFVRTAATQAAAKEQLISALELADALPLKLASPGAKHEATTMVALLLLSGAKLVWRGHRFEAATVPAMLEELGAVDAMMVLRALSTRSTALQIERVDAEAGRLLTELGRTLGDVEPVLKRHGWLGANDVPGLTRLFRLVLEPVPSLRATRDTLVQQFAGSDHPAMDKLFRSGGTARNELVILAWAAVAPEQFKFYTHAEATRRRVETLRSRMNELRQALAWPQLQQATRIGFLVLSGWGPFLGCWLLVGSGALVLVPGARGIGLVVAPVLAALLYRVTAARGIRNELRQTVPEANWSWRDGPARCSREFRLAARGASVAMLEGELQQVRDELGRLESASAGAAALPGLPRFRRVRLLGALSWILLLAWSVAAGWRVSVHPVSAKELKAAWAPAPETPPAPAMEPSPEEAEKDVKVSWPFRPGDTTAKLAAKSSLPATAAQVEYARAKGRKLVAPYRVESITAPIFLPVPHGDDVAVMMFDGKRGDVASHQMWLLEFAPLSRSWVELAERKGVYLDQ